VRAVVDPRKLRPQEIADAMNANRAEARRRAGLAIAMSELDEGAPAPRD
jgi:U3 small nucleolar ribonucleoprotein component